MVILFTHHVFDTQQNLPSSAEPGQTKSTGAGWAAF